jgi:hypothetical protein
MCMKSALLPFTSLRLRASILHAKYDVWHDERLLRQLGGQGLGIANFSNAKK